MLDQIGPATISIISIVFLVMIIYFSIFLLKQRSVHSALAGSHSDHTAEKKAGIFKKAAKSLVHKYRQTKNEKKELAQDVRASTLYSKNEKAHGMKGAALLDKLGAQENKSSLDNVSLLQSLEGMQGRTIDMFSSLALLIQSLLYTDKNESVIQAQENDEQQYLFQFTSQLQGLVNQSVGRSDIIQTAITQIEAYFDQLRAHFLEYADSYLVHSEDVVIHNIQFIKQNSLTELKRAISEAKYGQNLFGKEIKIEKKDLTREKHTISQAIKKKENELGTAKDSAQRFQLEQQKKLLSQQGKMLEQIEHYMAQAVNKMSSYQSQLTQSLSTIKTSDSRLDTAFEHFEDAYKKVLSKQSDLRKSIHSLSKEEHDLKQQKSVEGAISIVSHSLEEVQKKHDSMITEESTHVFSKLEEFIRIAYEICEEVYQFETRLTTLEQMESALTQAHQKMDANLARISSDDLTSIEQDVAQTLEETKHLIKDDEHLAAQIQQGKQYIEEQLNHLNTQFRLHQAELQKINGIYNQGISNLHVLATEAMKHTTQFYQRQTNQIAQ